MSAATLTVTLGAFCGDVVKEIKRASLAAGVRCEHAKGPGWIDAVHTFRFEGEKQAVLNLTSAIRNWLERYRYQQGLQ